MTQTVKANVINPAVYRDMVGATFLGQTRVFNSGAVLSDGTLVGNPGDTVHFPKWGTIGELDTLTEGTAMTPTGMTSSDQTATIKEVGKAVEITDSAQLTALGSPLDEARRQFGILASRRIDADLITQAQADETAQGGGTPFAVTAATGQVAASYARIVDGIKLFGDEWDPAAFAGIFINSAQHAELLADTNFITADKLGASATILTGQVGQIAGVSVFVTDRVAAKKILFLKRNSLGALYKRQPLVEQDRDILARSTILTTTIHYAVKRIDPRGVGVVTLAAS